MPRSCSILGVDFDLIDYQKVHETIEMWREKAESHSIAIVNPHSVIMCGLDEGMMQAVRASSLTLPDGVGVVMAAKILGYPHQGRVPGPALMLELCDRGRESGLRHFFYGGAEGVAEDLVARLTEQYPGLEIAGTFCPPFRELSGEEESRMRQMINDSRPDILWVGLGAPKQEKWIHRRLSHLRVPAIIGVGAAFDFHSGNVRWAPEWMRKAGLEWVFRLVHEPGRMFRRNVNNVIFLTKVVRQRWSPGKGGGSRPCR